MTTQRKKNGFVHADMEKRTQAERHCYRRMKTWHTLAQHPGLKATEIARLTGIWQSQVNNDLRIMGGVRCERVSAISFRWYAMTED